MEPTFEDLGRTGSRGTVVAPAPDNMSWPAGLTADFIEQCARTLDAMEDVSCLAITGHELPADLSWEEVAIETQDSSHLSAETLQALEECVSLATQGDFHVQLEAQQNQEDFGSVNVFEDEANFHAEADENAGDCLSSLIHSIQQDGGNAHSCQYNTVPEYLDAPVPALGNHGAGVLYASDERCSGSAGETLDPSDCIFLAVESGLNASVSPLQGTDSCSMVVGGDCGANTIALPNERENIDTGESLTHIRPEDGGLLYAGAYSLVSGTEGTIPPESGGLALPEINVMSFQQQLPHNTIPVVDSGPVVSLSDVWQSADCDITPAMSPSDSVVHDTWEHSKPLEPYHRFLSLQLDAAAGASSGTGRDVICPSPALTTGSRLSEVECELTVSEETAPSSPPTAAPAATADPAPYQEHNYDYPLEGVVAGEVRHSADHVYASRPVSPDADAAACLATDHRYAYSPPAALTEAELIRSISDQLGLPQDHGYSQRQVAPAPPPARLPPPLPPPPAREPDGGVEVVEPCTDWHPTPLGWEPALDEPAGHWVDPNLVMGVDAHGRQTWPVEQGDASLTSEHVQTQTCLRECGHQETAEDTEQIKAAEMLLALSESDLLPADGHCQMEVADTADCSRDDMDTLPVLERVMEDAVALLGTREPDLAEEPASASKAPDVEGLKAHVASTSRLESDVQRPCSPESSVPPSPETNIIIRRDSESNTVRNSGADSSPGIPLTLSSPEGASRGAGDAVTRHVSRAESAVAALLRQLAEEGRPLTAAQLRLRLRACLSEEQRRALAGPVPDETGFLPLWLARCGVLSDTQPTTLDQCVRISYPPYFKLLLLQFTRFMRADAVCRTFALRPSLMSRWRREQSVLASLAASSDQRRVRRTGGGRRRAPNPVQDTVERELELYAKESKGLTYEEARRIAREIYAEHGQKLPSASVWLPSGLEVETRRCDSGAILWLMRKFECGAATTRDELALYAGQPGGRCWAHRFLTRHRELERPHQTWQLRPPEPLRRTARRWAEDGCLTGYGRVCFLAEVPVLTRPVPCAVGPFGEQEDPEATLLISCSLDGTVLPSMLITKGSSGRVYADRCGLLTTEQTEGRVDAARLGLWLQLVAARAAAAPLVSAQDTGHPHRDQSIHREHTAGDKPWSTCRVSHGNQQSLNCHQYRSHSSPASKPGVCLDSAANKYMEAIQEERAETPRGSAHDEPPAARTSPAASPVAASPDGPVAASPDGSAAAEPATPPPPSETVRQCQSAEAAGRAGRGCLVVMNTAGCGETPRAAAAAAGVTVARVPPGLALVANPLMASRHLLMTRLAGGLSGCGGGDHLPVVRSLLRDWSRADLSSDLTRVRWLYRPGPPDD